MDKLAHMANWPLHMSVVYLISGMDHVCAEITPLCVKQSTVKVLERSFVGAHEKSRMLQLTTVTYCVGLSLPPPSGNILWHGLSFDKAFQKAITRTKLFLHYKSLIPFHHFAVHCCYIYLCLIILWKAFVSLFFSLLPLTSVWDLAPHRGALCSLFVLQDQASALSRPCWWAKSDEKCCYCER